MPTEPIEQFKEIELHPADLERYVPPLSPGEATLTETCRNYLHACRENLLELHKGPAHSEHLVGIATRMMDKLVLFLFAECEKEALAKAPANTKRAALIAQGGFGRQEMNVLSDLDLLFCYPKKKGVYIEILTEKMLYLLWDLGLEVGYATRTAVECKKLLQEDVTVLTALLDARFLAGDESVFRELTSEVRETLRSPAIQKKLIRKKLDEREARIQKTGGSVFVLEPNVRESTGGLRDLQLPLWIAKLLGRRASYEAFAEEGLITPNEAKILILARNFFWRIRNELHFIIEKKVDLLTFHRQERIAPKLGFEPSQDGILAVEKFMQAYYQLAYQVATITDLLIRRMTSERPGLGRFIKKIQAKRIDDTFRILDGRIAVGDRRVFEEEPLNLMRLFGHVQSLGLPIHTETKDYVRSRAGFVDEAFRRHPEAVKLFRGMLNRYQNLGLVFLAMHETHFLDEWMPEFKKLRCRVQHDAYHIYTIDTHSIFAVNELSKLRAGEYHEPFPHYEEVLAAVNQPEFLNLGVLLHDIGKGEGGNHSVKGAKIASQITRRLGFNADEQKTIDFLILSHLMMPHLSQRRDLEDPELVIQFARSMETMDRLNMLFLLTWADIRAVGPEAWTNWKGVLLNELYEKTREVITKGEFSKEKTRERINRVKEAVMAQIGDRYSREEFAHFLSIMPPRYFFAVTDKDIERHFGLHHLATREDVVVELGLNKEQNLNEVLIYSPNAPQVFSMVTGVMLAHGINIVKADLFQTTDGHLLVVLVVADAGGEPIRDEGLAEAVRTSLKGVLFGQIRVDDLIVKRKVPEYLVKKPVQKAQTKVVIDNDVSAYYTVIDVYAHDRLGLLYDITQTLSWLGCYVDVSKISTKVEQVTDVFYVKDIFGQKITSAGKLSAIKKGLMGVIGE